MGMGFTFMVTASVAVQPCASETVTLYEVELLSGGVVTVAVLPKPLLQI